MLRSGIQLRDKRISTFSSGYHSEPDARQNHAPGAVAEADTSASRAVSQCSAEKVRPQSSALPHWPATLDLYPDSSGFSRGLASLRQAGLMLR